MFVSYQTCLSLPWEVFHGHPAHRLDSPHENSTIACQRCLRSCSRLFWRISVSCRLTMLHSPESRSRKVELPNSPTTIRWKPEILLFTPRMPSKLSDVTRLGNYVPVELIEIILFSFRLFIVCFVSPDPNCCFSNVQDSSKTWANTELLINRLN